MRSTFAGLNTMVRGIMANQMSLDTTGHNITNAGTEGYSRQTVTLVTTRGEERAGMHGGLMVGTGVDASAVTRARDVYADIQYWNENPTQQYYKTIAKNFDKLETVFDDSQDLGLERKINDFYQTWVDLSTTASNASARTHVIEQGKNLSDMIQAKTAEIQDQIRSQYEDIKTEVGQIDDILNNILLINKQVTTSEVTGAMANDLRDRRDLLVDELSNYMNVTVTENQFGAYQINSGGVTLVNGASRAHLAMGEGISSVAYGIDYGVTDFNIKIVESNIAFLPQNGILKARFDAIAEDKAYIDKLADISSFMLSVFNDQHRQGWDMHGNYKFVTYRADGDYYGVDTVEVESEDALTAVNYLRADGTAVSSEEEANVMIRDGKYYLEDAEVTKLNPDTIYQTEDGEMIAKIPDTINFFGQGDTIYEYRYDADRQFNYLYKYDDSLSESERLLSGVKIIAELEVNTKFSENRGERYLAAATSIDVSETQDEDLNINRAYFAKDWGQRTGDGTNAVYLSELFNIAQETVLSDGKANALTYQHAILRNKAGEPIALDDKGLEVALEEDADTVYSTAVSKLSLNSYYHQAMSYMGIDAYSVDVNYDATEAIMTQINNWRDTTAGVDWNEELTHMIKFQKGFSSCSRCLNAMDEILDRLVNSTGVVGR